MNNKKNIILSDDDHWDHLLPLVFTKPISSLRIGILTIKEKWEKHLNGQASFITKDYLSDKFPIRIEDENWVINSRLLPNDQIVSLVNALGYNEALFCDDIFLAARMSKTQFQKIIENEDIDELKGTAIPNSEVEQLLIKRPYDIFSLNAREIQKDYNLLTNQVSSKSISALAKVQSPDNIFISEGAQISHCYIDASKGPVYIGKDAQIMQGAMIEGPFAMCDNAVIKMGAKIYSGTTLGPYCKVGGELNNVVFQGYANKAHDGFLGNSVIGEWCNLGADTNNSNLKNNYSEVKLWNYNSRSFDKSGLQFCGLIMGDHSKCGINTMFNTGTVVGVACNIFGSGYPRNFIPSFAWGGREGFKTNLPKKVEEVAIKVMSRRQKELTDLDKAILLNVFEKTAAFRNWEKA